MAAGTAERLLDPVLHVRVLDIGQLQSRHHVEHVALGLEADGLGQAGLQGPGRALAAGGGHAEDAQQGQPRPLAAEVAPGDGRLQQSPSGGQRAQLGGGAGGGDGDEHDEAGPVGVPRQGQRRPRCGRRLGGAGRLPLVGAEAVAVEDPNLPHGVRA